jgi:N-acetylmuramoyl-L-alanine amidase
LAPVSLFAAELTGIRLSSGPASTRVVLDLEQPAEHNVFTLSNPDRIVIDLPDTSAADALELPDATGVVRSVRTGPQADGALRVVLDLSQRSSPSSFALDPEGPYGNRVVVDLKYADTVGAEPSRRLVDQYTGRDLVVAIDAGHGGKDSGAEANGVREKDVVLQIARELARRVDAQPGLKAVMIRNGDHFIELPDRVRLAHEAQADLFISIHANAIKDDSSVRGAEVYSISTRRAATEAARRLADRENAADLIGGVSLSDVEDDVAQLLLRLTQDASRSKSLLAGEAILDRLSNVTPLLRTKVQQGPLVVLTSPDIPSLLVETAFVTNPGEARNLRDSGYQQRMAQALLDGILDFFSDNAPSESYLAHHTPPVQRGPIHHVISRGETLSEIAERYRVSLRQLRQSNQIRGDVIRIGQVLTIPTTG